MAIKAGNMTSKAAKATAAGTADYVQKDVARPVMMPIQLAGGTARLASLQALRVSLPGTAKAAEGTVRMKLEKMLRGIRDGVADPLKATPVVLNVSMSESALIVGNRWRRHILHDIITSQR